MKYSFYCLPLKQHVKSKISGIVKNKSYGIKGEYRSGGKTYNCHKICSKSEAERISKETGLDIQYAGMEAKSAETHTMPDGTEMPGEAHVETEGVSNDNIEDIVEVAMLGDDVFQPDGNGRVIGSNSASMTTATPGTDAVVTVNATPFQSETEDKIGPMSMASENPLCENCSNKGATIAGCTCGYMDHLKKDAESCCCGATSSKPCACMIEGNEKCSATCACSLESNAETESISEEMETFELSKPLFSRLTAHTDWDDMVSEGTVKVFRDNDMVQVSASGPFADDLLDMIIECHEFPVLDGDTYIDDRFMFESESNPIRKNALMFTGFGALGLISAILIYKQFKK